MTSATPKILYHITHIDNLEGIINSGGIICKNSVTGMNHSNIAFDNLQNRRANTAVPVAPSGTLHDYVPFFFCTKPPMLFTISRNNVPGAENTQNSIIYLVTNTSAVEQARIPFVFTDGHAIMALTEFFKDVQDFDKIEWESINATYWADTEEDPDRKRKKQAEFLVHKQAPLSLFGTIVCQNRIIAQRAALLFENNRSANHIIIEVKPEWYY